MIKVDRKKIFIICNNMVKHVKGWELSAKLEYQDNVYLRNFLGVKVRNVKDYAKP